MTDSYRIYERLNQANTIIKDCPFCAGSVKRNKDRTSFLCEYCNRTFYINVDERSSIQKINNAEIHLHDFHDLPSAKKSYLEATELNAGDYRSWYGLAKVLTDNFTDLSLTSSQVKEIEDYYIFRAIKTSDYEIEEAIKTIFEEYKRKVFSRIENDRTGLNSQINADKSEKAKLESDIKALKASLDKHYTEKKAFEDANRSCNSQIKSPDKYDSEMVWGFIGSTIATIILGKLLFFTTDKSWDLSTLVIGIPFIFAAFGFICTSANVLITAIGNSVINRKNTEMKGKIEFNSKRLGELSVLIKSEETKLSELSNKLSKVNTDLDVSQNKVDAL